MWGTFPRISTFLRLFRQIFAIPMAFLVCHNHRAMSHEPEDDFVRTDPEEWSAMPVHAKKKYQKSALKKVPTTIPPQNYIISAEQARHESTIGVKRAHEEQRRKLEEERIAKEEEFHRMFQHLLPEIRADFDHLIREECASGSDMRAVDLPLRYDTQYAELLAIKMGPELQELGYEVSKPFTKDVSDDDGEDIVWHLRVSW
jgi:hypothetical protein